MKALLLALALGAGPAAAAEPSAWEEALDAKLPESPELLKAGQKAYGFHCAVCHGGSGDGRGPARAFKTQKPRDFRHGLLKLKTTAAGTVASDEDLYRTITRGFPGHMPSFCFLPKEKRWGLVYTLRKFLAASGRPAGAPLEVGAEPPETPGSLERGKRRYQALGCAACHGEAGDGKGALVVSAPAAFADADGGATLPADFVRGDLKAGRAPRDVVRSLLTGFEGTAMPSFAATSDAAGTREPLWDLARYVLHLKQGR